MRVMRFRQIHSDIVQVVNSANSEPSGDALKGDALITTRTRSPAGGTDGQLGFDPASR